MTVWPYIKCPILLLLLFAVLSSHAQEPVKTPDRYDLRGQVQDAEGNPLSGASVLIHETHRGVITDSDGRFEIEKVRPGRYHLHVQYLGYEPATRTIQLSDQDLELKFTLNRSSLEISEVVVEAHPFRKGQQEQSLTIEAVGDGFLEKYAGATLMNSIDKMSGVNAVNIGTGIGKPMVRGMSFNRVMVTQQGIKQEGQQWGVEHGLEVDPFNVGRVEVIKGPAAVLYGSEAMAGVVNLKPHPIPENNTLGAEVLANGHSLNEMAGGSAMLEGNSGGHFFRARYSMKAFADYRVPADSFTYDGYRFPLHGRRLKNTAGYEQNYALTAGISQDWGVSRVTVSRFSQRAGFFPGAHGRPSVQALIPNGSVRDIEYPFQDIDHLKVVANNSILVGENWLEIDAGYQHNRRIEREAPHDAAGPNPASDLALDLSLRTYSLNARYHHDITNKVDGITGFTSQFKQNRIDGFSFLIPAFNRFEGGIFTYQEYHHRDDLTFNASVRLDYGEVDVESFSEPLYDGDSITGLIQRAPAIHRSFTSLSGGMGLSYFPEGRWQYKLNLGSSFRYPAVAELASNGMHHGAFRFERGNPELRPERGYQLDFNMSYRKEKFLFRWTPFFNFFDHYIFLSPTGRFAQPEDGGTGQVYEYRQATALHTGTEVVFDYHLLENFHLELIGEFVFGHNLEANLPLPFTPPATFTMELEYHLEPAADFCRWVLFNYNNRLAASQNRVERNERRTPGYIIHNLVIGTELQAGKQPLRLYLQGQNLLNNHYFNHISFYRQLNLPAPGRNLMLTLKVPFRIIE